MKLSPEKQKKISQKLQALLDGKKWSQSNVAEEIGEQRQRLGRYFKGNLPEPILVFAAICASLDVSMEEVLTGQDSSQPQPQPEATVQVPISTVMEQLNRRIDQQRSDIRAGFNFMFLAIHKLSDCPGVVTEKREEIEVLVQTAAKLWEKVNDGEEPVVTP